MKSANQYPKERILVIDDEENILETLFDILTIWEFDVVTVDNGKEAIELAKKEHFDLFLVDQLMADLDGIETITELNKITQSPKIIISGHFNESFTDKLIQLNIANYVTKPVNFALLKMNIELALKRWRLQQETEALQMFVSDLNELNLQEDEHEMLHILVKKIQIRLNCKGVTLYVYNDTRTALIPLIIINKNVTETIFKEFKEIEIGQGLCGKVAKEGKTILVNNVEHDSRRSKKFDNLFGVPSNIITVPCIYKNTPYGVLQAIDKKDGFNRVDQLVLESYAAHIGPIRESIIRTNTDRGTGLFNRQFFERSFEQLIERTKRYQQRHKRTFHSSLVLIDIDFFKNINDKYGHSVGDLVLQDLSEDMRDNVRVIDVIARIGGEEFAVICQDTNIEEAYVVAEKLRQYVESQTYLKSSANPINITISLGVSSIPHDGIDKDEVFIKADKALYYSKQNGRNLASKYDEEIMSDVIIESS